MSSNQDYGLKTELQAYKIKLENHYRTEANKMLTEAVKVANEEAIKNVKKKYFPGCKRTLTDAQREENRKKTYMKYYEKKRDEKRMNKIKTHQIDRDTTELMVFINDKVKTMTDLQRQQFKQYIKAAIDHMELSTHNPL